MTTDFESRFDTTGDVTLPESVDEAALRRMERVAMILDESVPIPGTNASVGLDPILGVLPVAGDAVSALFSLYIVAESAYLGVSFRTLIEMIANVAVDLAGGSIPYVGTVFDAFWKANKRNVDLVLEELAATEPTDDGMDASVEIPVRTE
jgi:hypothetical protein